jgi:hypothetical protein
MSRLFEWWSSKGAPERPTQVEREVSVHTSPALNILFHEFRPEQKYHILDLGRAFSSNVEFFSQYTCRIYIEDFYSTLSSFDYLSPEDGISYDSVFEYLLPYRRGTRFDVVLTWDLLNYLEREEFRAFFRHLDGYCRRGSFLFALISTAKHIPEKPTHFRILDFENLQYEAHASVLRPCPQYQPSDFNQLMPGFRTYSSFQLRNNFREYLFLRE